MSMDVGGAKGGVKADINVTPLVDVMLVLLIIMMLVAPLLQQGVQIRLPTAGNTTDHPETQGQSTVTIAANKPASSSAASSLRRSAARARTAAWMIVAGSPASAASHPLSAVAGGTSGAYSTPSRAPVRYAVAQTS